MTVEQRLERARNDIITIRVNVPNSRANVKVLSPLMRAQSSLDDVILNMDEEQKEIPC